MLTCLVKTIIAISRLVCRRMLPTRWGHTGNTEKRLIFLEICILIVNDEFHMLVDVRRECSYKVKNTSEQVFIELCVKDSYIIYSTHFSLIYNGF